MRKKFTKIILVLILTIVTVLPVSAKADVVTEQKTEAEQISRFSDPVDFAKYQSFAFYGRSAPELIPLDMTADFISLVGYSDGDEPDELICYIQAKDDSGFELVIPFTADGDVYTIPCAIPPVECKVFFTGSASIRKSDALVIFTTKG